MSRCGCPSESVRRRGSDPCPLKEKDPQLRESHRAQPVSPRCRECWGAAVDCQTVGRDDSSARRPIRTGLDEATHTPEQSVLSRVGHTMTAARPDWLTYLFRPRRRRRSRNSHAACTAFLLRAKSSWAARMLSLADLRRPRAFFAYRRAAAINRAAFRRSRFSSESLNSASAVMYRVTCISNADNTSTHRMLS